MRLNILPFRQANAAENMAADLMLLQRYPENEYPRFRAYGWHRPAYTFGYSQKIAFVRAQVPKDTALEICRRPTGGGLVDHRHDWTYAVVIPRGHPAEATRAIESYRLIHDSLARALSELAQPAILEERLPSDEENLPGICFQRAEKFDVVHPQTGAKIAGAAQKRNKRGLLFQGSIARSAITTAIDWEKFQELFTNRLASALGVTPEKSGWPDWSEDELGALTSQYGNEEWTELR